MHGLAAAERILAGERIVKHEYALCAIWITLQVGDEYREGERGSIPGAQGIFEARLIDRSLSITKVYLRVVDDQLVRRAGDPTSVCGLCLRDGESGIEVVEQLIDPALVGFHHLVGMGLQLRADLSLLLVERGLLHLKPLVIRAQRGDALAVPLLLRVETHERGFLRLQIARSNRRL